MTSGSELGEAVEVVPATSIERIDCPLRAAELGRLLAGQTGPCLSSDGDKADAAEIAAALLRGDLVVLRRSPPELDDYDGSVGLRLCDLAAAAF